LCTVIKTVIILCCAEEVEVLFYSGRFWPCAVGVYYLCSRNIQNVGPVEQKRTTMGKRRRESVARMFIIKNSQ
jgi:hypothetical protein